MGIKKSQKLVKWSDTELAFLKANVELFTNTELAEKLGRTRHAVVEKLYQMRVIRSKAARKKCIKNLFVKGHKTWNKNKKGIHLSPATEFKKGNTSARKMLDGEISIWHHKRSGNSYKVIKLNGKFEHLHRVVWQREYGSLLSDQMVGFKNGNTLDCDPDNLYLMSRAESMKKNGQTKSRERNSSDMKKAWAEGKFYKHDTWIAFTLSQNNKSLREKIMQSPELIELQRMKFKLKAAINAKT